MVCAPVRRDNPRALAMLYLICITISSVDLAHYGVSRAKDWISVDCGTKPIDVTITCADIIRMISWHHHVVARPNTCTDFLLALDFASLYNLNLSFFNLQLH